MHPQSAPECLGCAIANVAHVISQWSLLVSRWLQRAFILGGSIQRIILWNAG
eukprot:m.490756 g.490756  ORF g.490756 m.490756 type:complete len:52 (-) comp21783_c0_seq2:1439-1594(-)